MSCAFFWWGTKSYAIQVFFCFFLFFLLSLSFVQVVSGLCFCFVLLIIVAYGVWLCLGCKLGCIPVQKKCLSHVICT